MIYISYVSILIRSMIVSTYRSVYIVLVILYYIVRNFFEIFFFSSLIRITEITRNFETKVTLREKLFNWFGSKIRTLERSFFTRLSFLSRKLIRAVDFDPFRRIDLDGIDHTMESSRESRIKFFRFEFESCKTSFFFFSPPCTGQIHRLSRQTSWGTPSALSKWLPGRLYGDRVRSDGHQSPAGFRQRVRKLRRRYKRLRLWEGARQGKWKKHPSTFLLRQISNSSSVIR